MINKNIFFLLLFLTFQCACADEQEDLFKKVFGNTFVESSLQLKALNKEIGLLKVRIQGERIISVEGKTYYAKLNALLKKPITSIKTHSRDWLNSNELPYKLIYDPENIVLKLDIDQDLVKPTFYNVGQDLKLKYAGEALDPAPLAASISYSLDKTIGDKAIGGDYFSASYNSFFNMNGFILSTRGYYQDSSQVGEESFWFRGDTNLTKDFIGSKVRLQFGDVYTTSFSFLNSLSLGGVSIQKQFAIDPYDQPFTRGSEEVKLTSRSHVKTYVNGSLYRQEVLPAGNYRLTNLPLLNGINFIRLEIKDAQGLIRIVDLDIPISIGILKKGKYNFSLNSGKAFTDSQKSRDYSDTNTTSGFLQYGVTDTYSIGTFTQMEEDFLLYGLSNGFASRLGNFFFDIASSNKDNAASSSSDESGHAIGVTWQYQPIGYSLARGFSLALRAEKFFSEFRDNSSSTSDIVDKNFESSLSIPILKKLSLNLGYSKSFFQDKSLQNRNSYRTSVNWRITPLLTANIYASKTTSSLGVSDTQASLFLNWRFGGETNTYGSIFKDLEQDSTRVSFLKDNSNRLYTPRYGISYEDTDDRDRFNINSKVSTPMADLYLRGSLEDDSGVKSKVIGATVAGSLLFAMDKELGVAVARPTQGSFAIFKPGNDIRDQKISIKSSSPYADTNSPLFGDLAMTNILSYQYREVQIDTSGLDYGTTLDKEKFVMLPHYRSGHLIKIKDKGLISLEGFLFKDGKPVKLKLGRVGNSAFFTDRNGYFFVDGISVGREKLEVIGVGSLNLDVFEGTETKKGYINLGKINLK